MATETCTIKRVSLNASSGQTSLPALHLANIECTPLMHMDETSVDGTRGQTISGAMSERKQVMIFEDLDIKKGDILLLNGVEYPISEANRWVIHDPFLVLIVEKPQVNVEREEIFVR
jgi:hypothetical protein